MSGISCTGEWLCVTAGFHCGVKEIFVLPGCYTE